jgi:hypothetical protein
MEPISGRVASTGRTKEVEVDSSGRIEVVEATSVTTVQHFSGTATGTAATMTASNTPVEWLIVNKETVSTEKLLISFDDGTSWFILNANSYLNVETSDNGIKVKADAGSDLTVTYQAIVTTRS